MKILFRPSGLDNIFFIAPRIWDFKSVIFLLCLVLLVCYGCKEPKDVSADNQILSFSLNSVPNAYVSIDHDGGVINITVPYGTILTHLTAEIQLSDRATVVPAGNITQNFSKPIFYTVTTTNGVKKVYQIVIYFTKQNNPVISSFSKDTVRAGERLIVSG